MTPPQPVPRPAALVVQVWGWTLRWDLYGLSVFDTHRFEADAELAEQAAADAEHDCRRDHPDAPCDEDDQPAGFSEDDLIGLFAACRAGRLDEVEAMAEFYAGIRADPERPT